MKPWTLGTWWGVGEDPSPGGRDRRREAGRERERGVERGREGSWKVHAAPSMKRPGSELWGGRQSEAENLMPQEVQGKVAVPGLAKWLSG